MSPPFRCIALLNAACGLFVLHRLLYVQKPLCLSPRLQSRKNSSGVTASTNFGSGISGLDNENSTGWPMKKKSNIENADRVSPELKVQAQLARSGKMVQKTDPINSKYIHPT